MDILELALEDEFAVGDLLPDLVEALEDGIGIGLCDDALAGPHWRAMTPWLNESSQPQPGSSPMSRINSGTIALFVAAIIAAALLVLYVIRASPVHETIPGALSALTAD